MKKHLIIDDIGQNLEAARRLLQEHGYMVRETLTQRKVGSRPANILPVFSHFR